MTTIVSIIIPTYNRAHFLGKTLESVLAQTYKNWECIVVDDGSTDYTKELMGFYCEKDSRFYYYHRPKIRPKGANSCRNFGYEMSKGEYINWFDSDDLMHVDFINLKIRTIVATGADYVISKSENFEDNQENEQLFSNDHYYNFEEYSITNYNYVTQKINWLTYDFFAKRSLVEKVKFNESLKAFQERNFFCKITLFSVKAAILDEYLTKVRIHQNSIQAELKLQEKNYLEKLLEFYHFTFWDLKDLAVKETIDFLFLRYLKLSMHLKSDGRIVRGISRVLLKEKRISAFAYYVFFQMIFYSTGRGYFFRKKVLEHL